MPRSEVTLIGPVPRGAAALGAPVAWVGLVVQFARSWAACRRRGRRWLADVAVRPDAWLQATDVKAT